VRFEPTIPAFELAKTVHAFSRRGNRDRPQQFTSFYNFLETSMIVSDIEFKGHQFDGLDANTSS
jgi:hypothetical protein